MCCTRLVENTERKNSRSAHHRTVLSGYTFARHVSTIGKKLLSSNICSTCPQNMLNFGLLTAEIEWRIWGTPANFNRFRVLASFRDLINSIQQRGPRTFGWAAII